MGSSCSIGQAGFSISNKWPHVAVVGINPKRNEWNHGQLTEIRLDALLLGDKEIIPPDKIPSEQRFIGKDFKLFKLRDPWVVQEQAQREKVKTYIISLAKNLRLNLTSGRTWPQNGLPCNITALGKTRNNPFWFDQTRVDISIEMVEPLLRTDLTSAERAVDTFRLASTILHETTVCYEDESPIL